jgi:hypothetical protein
MDYPSQAPELRHLLAVARGLRELADDAVTCDGDSELFLTAAAALEARATWTAAALPGERYNPAATVHLHKPVNLVI